MVNLSGAAFSRQGDVLDGFVFIFIEQKFWFFRFKRTCSVKKKDISRPA